MLLACPSSWAWEGGGEKGRGSEGREGRDHREGGEEGGGKRNSRWEDRRKEGGNLALNENEHSITIS